MKRRFLAIIMAVLVMGVNSVTALGAEAEADFSEEISIDVNDDSEAEDLELGHEEPDTFGEDDDEWEAVDEELRGAEQEYIIYYNGNGGRGSMAATKAKFGAEITLSKNQFVNDDYKFYGWNTKADGTGDFYGPEAKVKDLVTIKNGTIILYAQWRNVNEITVYFDGNGGTVSVKQKNVKVGATYGVMPTAVRNGYRFAGWSTSPETAEVIKESTAVTIKDDHTLYAKWSEEDTVHIFLGENEVTDDEITIKSGDSVGTALTAGITPSSAEQKVSWESSNKSVATVSETGVVLGLKSGYAYVTATSTANPAKTARVRIHVTEADPQQVDVSGNDAMRVGEEALFTATVSPLNAPKETVWSVAKAEDEKGEAASNPSDYADIDTYSQNNTVLVTAKKVGKITLHAASTANLDVFGELEIEILPETAEGIRILVAEGYKDELLVGEKSALKAVISPASASQKVRWESNNEKIATVDKDGFVTAISKGTAYIYGISEDSESVRGSYRIRVNEPSGGIKYLSVDGTAVTEAGASVVNGKGITFAAYDEDGNEIPVSWSVENEDKTGNASYATISGRGYFKAIIDDSFKEPVMVRVIARTIEASEEASALVRIIPSETTIKRIPAARVYFDKKTATIYANGNTDNYINLGDLVHVLGKNDSEPTNPGLSWTSSNTKAASVDGCGIVTALSTVGKAKATAVITAKTQDGSKKKATIKIVVENRAVELKLVSASSSDDIYASSNANAEYEYKKLKLSPGKSFSVKGIITPSVTDNKVTYESLDPEIATVSSKGKITAKTIGTATILATSSEGNLSAAFRVSVFSAAKSVKLNKKSLKLGEGNSFRLEATVMPLKVSQKCIFTSEDPDIARVDEATGLVTAVAKGSTTILCKSFDGSKTAKCKVTVGNAIRKIDITAKSDCVAEKKTLKMRAVFNDAEADEVPINRQVIWSVIEGAGTGEASINPSTGVLTGITEGQVKVKVTSALDDSVYAVSDYIMVYVPVKKATINKKSVTLKPEGMCQLKVTIKPDSKNPSKRASLKTAVRYSLEESEDKAYVTVDAGTGLITAKKKTDKPVVVIATYTPYGGKQKTLKCKVTVK